MNFISPVLVSLTPAEVSERGQELARVLHEMEQLETAKREYLQDHKDQIEPLQEKARELGQAVRMRQEYREAQKALPFDPLAEHKPKAKAKTLGKKSKADDAEASP